MNFGALRVLNDDTVDGGMGFGRHPHQNMEIISIPMEGDLEHQDSMGNTAVIRNGDIQAMSAGTGIYHSEKNKENSKPVKFLQIWIIPDKLDVTPRYDQVSLNPDDRHNKLQQVLSPDAGDAGVWIHQQAWFSLGKFDKGVSTEYQLHRDGNGVYIFNLCGSLKVNDELLSGRDGYGIWNTDKFPVLAETNSEFLLMEVPMKF